MQDKNKRMWDEALGGIDEKFTAEAAEMLRACEEDGNAHSEKGIEFRTERKTYKRKNIWAWGISAAAVLVVGAVGAAVWMNSPHRNVIETADSARSADSSGVTLYKSDFDNSPIQISDIYNYNIDYDIFETFFIGGWQSSNTAEVTEYSYIGSSTNLAFYGGLHSVYEKDDGYYMISMSDGKSQVCFIPKDDTEHMYLYDNVGSVIEKVYYSDVYDRVSEGTDEDREITAGNYLSCAAVRRLDDDLRGVLTTVYSDVESGKYNDNEGNTWSLIGFTEDGYEAPKLISRDDSKLVVGLLFGNTENIDETRLIYAEITIDDGGSWGWYLTDEAGRTYYTGNVMYSGVVDNYDKWFMGEWENAADPKESFTLSYTEDFFESGISRYNGFGNTVSPDGRSCIYMIAETLGENATSVIPYRKDGVIYAVYTDEPEKMYCYADNVIGGEPYAVYNKVAEASHELPERGEVTRLGLYKFLADCGDELVYLFDSVENNIECEGMPCVNGGAPYYILSRSDEAVVVMLDYTNEGSDDPVSAAISFVYNQGGWRIADVERAVALNSDGIRAGITENGYYYLVEEYTDAGVLMQVYYYSNNDSIMYELNAEGRSEYRLNDVAYICDGDSLYVLGTADGWVCAAAYSGGKIAGTIHLSEVQWEFSEPSLTISDGTLHAEWTDGGQKSADVNLDDFSDLTAQTEAGVVDVETN